jgi:hypothetical protein
MIGLTDHQLKIVMGAARMLPVEKLHGFIEASNYPAVTDHRYTKSEALAKAASSGHCGPWA